MSTLSTQTAPAGPGATSQAPNLPPGFTDTFASAYVRANGIRQHVVIGGEGPPLLLVHGWPETWYAWRLVMPALAEHHTVIAVDQRGIGLTDRPDEGYDAGTLATDLVALMDELGHARFTVVGHDTGVVVAYALAADHPDRVDRLVVAEIPGPPLPDHSPPLFAPAPVNDRLWHIAFNRAGQIAEQLVLGREEAFFGYEFAIQGDVLPADVVAYYVARVSEPGALAGSLAFYRAWDTTMAQNALRSATTLTMPVLAIGGDQSWGDAVGGAMSALAQDVQTVVIEGASHWVAEEAPEQVLAALTEFLRGSPAHTAAG
jgi:pimeloyl-ACP methyl ester carboxylesterase